MAPPEKSPRPALADLIPLAEAATRLARPGGRAVHRATVYRWASRGLGGVVLTTYAVGATLCTTEADLIRFFEELARARRGRRPVKGSRSGCLDAVERALDALGIQ